MTASDAKRWNERYRGIKYSQLQSARPIVVEALPFLPNTGLALDVAMGLGSNANCVASHGMSVIGVDISWEAVRRAKAAYPNLQVVCADLTEFSIPAHRFDAILILYYMQRSLLSSLTTYLKPGGVAIVETLTIAMQETRPDLNSDYLLSPKEILNFFPEWEILKYREGWISTDHEKMKAVASIVARSPFRG